MSINKLANYCFGASKKFVFLFLMTFSINSMANLLSDGEYISSYYIPGDQCQDWLGYTRNLGTFYTYLGGANGDDTNTSASNARAMCVSGISYRKPYQVEDRRPGQAYCSSKYERYCGTPPSCKSTDITKSNVKIVIKSGTQLSASTCTSSLQAQPNLWKLSNGRPFEWENSYKCLKNTPYIDPAQFTDHGIDANCKLTKDVNVFCTMCLPSASTPELACSPEAEFITNGAFDTARNNPAIGGGTYENYYTLRNYGWATYETIKGWTSPVGLIEVQTGIIPLAPVVNSANNVIELDTYKIDAAAAGTGSNATVQQTVYIPKDGAWKLRFDYSPRQTTNPGPTETSKFDILIDGVVKTFTPNLTWTGQYKSAEIDLNLTVGTHTIAFRGTGIEDDAGALIDNVSLKCSTTTAANVCADGFTCSGPVVNGNCTSTCMPTNLSRACTTEEQAKCGKNTDCYALGGGSVACACKTANLCDGRASVGYFKKADGTLVGTCSGDCFHDNATPCTETGGCQNASCALVSGEGGNPTTCTDNTDPKKCQWFDSLIGRVYSTGPGVNGGCVTATGEDARCKFLGKTGTDKLKFNCEKKPSTCSNSYCIPTVTANSCQDDTSLSKKVCGCAPGYECDGLVQTINTAAAYSACIGNCVKISGTPCLKSNSCANAGTCVASTVQGSAYVQDCPCDTGSGCDGTIGLYADANDGNKVKQVCYGTCKTGAVTSITTGGSAGTGVNAPVVPQAPPSGSGNGTARGQGSTAAICASCQGSTSTICHICGPGKPAVSPRQFP